MYTKSSSSAVKSVFQVLSSITSPDRFHILPSLFWWILDYTPTLSYGCHVAFVIPLDWAPSTIFAYGIFVLHVPSQTPSSPHESFLNYLRSYAKSHKGYGCWKMIQQSSFQHQTYILKAIFLAIPVNFLCYLPHSALY